MAQMSPSQKVRLGAFLGTGAALIAISVILLAGRALVEDRDEYFIRFSNSEVSFSGLETGSSVKYSGIKVGRVEQIRIDPDDVSVIEVTLSLDEDTPVAEDSTASLGSVGITGLKYIELSRGSPSARIREPGEEIPAGASFMDELSTRALSIAAQLEEILGNIQGMTNSENQERLARVLDSTASLLEENESRLEEVVSNISQFTATGAEVAVEVKLFAEELRTTRSELDALIKDGRKTLGDEGLGHTVASTNELLDHVNLVVKRNQLVVESSLRDLQTSAENLYDLTEQVKDNPSLLFRSSKTAGEDLVR